MKNSCLFLFLCLLPLIFFSACNTAVDNTKIDPVDKHSELQMLENKIYKKILEGDKMGALDLLDSLIHPSENSAYKFTGEFVSFSEYWLEKRQILRDEIMGLSSSDISMDVDALSDMDTVQNDKYLYFSSDLMGLYVYQFDNGATKFYKFSVNDNKEINILYQDNVTGNVKVINYLLESFDENSKEVILKDKTDLKKESKVYFIKDFKSESGYKLIDSEGFNYQFVSR
jgi:hypothetical protein